MGKNWTFMVSKLELKSQFFYILAMFIVDKLPEIQYIHL